MYTIIGVPYIKLSFLICVVLVQVNITKVRFYRQFLYYLVSLINLIIAILLKGFANLIIYRKNALKNDGSVR